MAEDGYEKKPQAGKKKRISSSSLDEVRQWQTFILALIIIVSYIVFFGWIISISADSNKNTEAGSNAADKPNASSTPNQSKNAVDYSGMTTLTGTFGIIAAAVVGYYFGTRNLKHAADIAQSATDVAIESKNAVEEKKIDLDTEREDHVKEIDLGLPLYREVLNAVTDDNLKKKIEDRIKHLESSKQTKIKKIRLGKSSQSEEKST